MQIKTPTVNSRISFFYCKKNNVQNQNGQVGPKTMSWIPVRIMTPIICVPGHTDVQTSGTFRTNRADEAWMGLFRDPFPVFAMENIKLRCNYLSERVHLHMLPMN